MDRVILYDPAIHAHHVAALAQIHAECISSPPYTIATFKPPLDLSLMEKWWAERAAEVATGEREIIMELADDPETGKEEVAGYVALAKPWTQTGPFRGSVEKLLVRPKYRQRGIATRIMAKLEEVARRDERTLLVLDTEEGSPAEKIYPKLGYTYMGTIPEYEISPVTGERKAGVFFWKNLEKSSPLVPK